MKEIWAEAKRNQEVLQDGPRAGIIIDNIGQRHTNQS
jgi:hypothetical protein